ncbi:MAG: deoxyhypusine synthase [Candidatus Aenigmarchaeota archaeon]|nr:deoxyhypusine synthase [Candidatus Aenigmarchaeota archaeon]
MRKVEDLSVTKGTSLADLGVQYYAAGGFVAKKVGAAIQILEEMFRESKLSILSFPAAVVSTGTRGLIKDLIRQKKFSMVMTTCGTLDHDFSRVWKDYYHGSFEDDDIALHKRKIHRLGNVQIPISSHGEIIEEKLQPMLQDMYDKGLRSMGTHEFIWELGKRLDGEPRKEESLIYWCWKHQIPMIIPGITDGTFGLNLLLFMQDHKDFRVDVWKDEFYLMERMFDKVKTGALMIGGGISKHHTIWWSQFKDGLDYAVYITTAPEWDGSLSGARLREGISWNKVQPNAKEVTIEGDATVLLPLVVGPLL